MSLPLISRNDDLKRLEADGYSVEVKANHLTLAQVPYVTSSKQVRLGTLVSELTLAGDLTGKPSTHVVHFCGEYPCDQNGMPIESIRHQSTRQDLGGGLTVDHSFSSKPPDGYSNYYDKMSTYAKILSNPASALDPSATPCPHLPVVTAPADSVFNYLDTASSRAGTNDLSERLRDECIAIVGLGGTGAYVLDLVAKTPVRRITLFDADTMMSHNAFRTPGAAPLESLRGQPKKVEYLRALYSNMHRNIVAHDVPITVDTLELLAESTMVFICIDDASAKRPLLDFLRLRGVPFIDAGMGVVRGELGLYGVVRVTTSTPEFNDPARLETRISMTSTPPGDYATNIQIAELNALNACMAVIKWKKIRGFYADLDREHFAAYTIDGNHMVNEDKA
jgi:hypothetical protein